MPASGRLQVCDAAMTSRLLTVHDPPSITDVAGGCPLACRCKRRGKYLCTCTYTCVLGTISCRHGVF